MTVPANLTARHYAEQAVLAAVIADRKARHAFKGAVTGDDDAEYEAWCAANDALTEAMNTYYAAVQADTRVPDPVVENIAEAGTYEVHDCPGGAYVITETPAGITAVAPIERVEHEVPDLLAALQASVDRHKARQVEPDPADRYDSGYVASPAVADGRAADEFYGRDA